MKMELTEHQAQRLAWVLDYVMEAESTSFQEYMAEHDNPENHIFWQAESLWYQLGMNVKFDREKAIQALVDNDKDFILNGDGGGLEWLGTILESGHTGYTDQTDIQLHQECKARDLPVNQYTEDTE